MKPDSHLENIFNRIKPAQKAALKKLGLKTIKDLLYHFPSRYSSIAETKPDPDFEKDRERFCLSGERLEKNLKEKSQLEGIARLVDEWKERDKHKDEYDAIKKLKKLTVVALEDLLAPLCEKAQYVKFQLGSLDMGKDLIVSFTVHEANPERTDLASSHNLQRIIKKALADTNWRLMSDGISYRMGILTGRLRAYEREEDLLKLVKNGTK